MAAQEVNEDAFLIGSQCSMKSCGELDFLPVTCPGCHEKFCSMHIQASAHNCGSLQALRTHVCPNCVFSTLASSNTEGESAIEAHQRDGCLRKTEENRCTFVSSKGNRCKRCELIPVECGYCHQNFCFKHRSEVTHRCEAFAAQKAALAKEAESKGKLVSKKGRETLSLSELWVTQCDLTCPAALPALATYVREGGIFTRHWAKGSRKSMQMTADAEVSTGALYPIHVWRIGKQHYLWRGHHFAMAILLGGRDHLDPAEYIVRRATIDVKSVNLKYEFMCPFDPEKEIRLSSFRDAKQQVRQRLLAGASADEAIAFAISLQSSYVQPRNSIFTLADLAKSLRGALQVSISDFMK